MVFRRRILIIVWDVSVIVGRYSSVINLLLHALYCVEDIVTSFRFQILIYHLNLSHHQLCQQGFFFMLEDVYASSDVNIGRQYLRPS